MVVKPINHSIQSMLNHTIVERTMVHRARDSKEKQSETEYTGKTFREILEKEIVKLRYFV